MHYYIENIKYCVFCKLMWLLTLYYKPKIQILLNIQYSFMVLQEYACMKDSQFQIITRFLSISIPRQSQKLISSYHQQLHYTKYFKNFSLKEAVFRLIFSLYSKVVERYLTEYCLNSLRLLPQITDFLLQSPDMTNRSQHSPQPDK